MLEVLCQVAFCTAPPVSYGFDLSDYWAFMRYMPALSADRDLRLRSEWTDLDAHQKTVLSDDLGMGVTASLLMRALGLSTLASTNYAVTRFGKPRMYLKASGKRGPAKSPDFVGFDRAGNVCVIECKGTQTFGNLIKSMNDGIPQKRNLVVGGGLALRESVVGGLFIPQYKAKHSAVCRFVDPAIEVDLAEGRGGEDPWQVFARANLAAALHLMGYGAEGNAVALGEQREFSALFQRANELSEVQGDGNLAMARTRTVFYPQSLKSDEGVSVAGLRASIGISTDIFKLLATNNVDAAIQASAARAQREREWAAESLDGGFMMMTPTGLMVKLELLQQEDGGVASLERRTG
ncbi:hypothetical protein [Corallococcus llansteffanensis]|uniref:hypothetical protein n=1 Tax=Corallococcus llansteffanensis TaxID=2316731 RepID=UPI0011C4710A|nr:hypothetical protein [Corallococcus llansteffanensis]